LLCWHHLEELLGHDDFTVAQNRFHFLQSLPVVAWVSCYDLPDHMGSIVDILAYEAEVAYRNPALDFLGVRDQVRGKLFRYGTGEQALALLDGPWETLRPIFKARATRARELIAISRATHLDFSKEKVSDFLTNPLRTTEGTARAFGWLHKGLHEQIASRGDRRIPDAGAVANGFMRDVVADGLNIGESEAERIEYLRRHEIYASDLKPDTHMGDLFELGMFRTRLKIVQRLLSVPWDELVSVLTPSRIPSALLSNALRRYGQDLRERKGSDMADGHLAALCAYADLSFVDGRTNENIRRAIHADGEVKKLVRHADKAGQYFTIPDRIRKWTFSTRRMQ
jgi:hypothetical protein